MLAMFAMEGSCISACAACVKSKANVYCVLRSAPGNFVKQFIRKRSVNSRGAVTLANVWYLLAFMPKINCSSCVSDSLLSTVIWRSHNTVCACSYPCCGGASKCTTGLSRQTEITCIGVLSRSWPLNTGVYSVGRCSVSKNKAARPWKSGF